MCVDILDTGSQETETTERTPKTFPLLRPSAFSMPVTTTASGIFINMLLLFALCCVVHCHSYFQFWFLCCNCEEGETDDSHNVRFADVRETSIELRE